MSGVNKVMLIGNVGKDPDITTFGDGVTKARFSIATTENFSNRQGERQSRTEWHTIVLWRGLAEIAQKYLTKGKLVYVEGKLRTRKWTDKEGIERTAVEIEGESFTMLGSPTGERNNPSNAVGSSTTTGADDSVSFSLDKEEEDDGMPF